MSEYWRGVMDWPLERTWRCETCNSAARLIWGLVHGVCRCGVCHTEYSMRGGDGNRVTVPICRLKDEYKEPARLGWQKYGTPITQWTDEQWEELLCPVTDTGEENE